MYIMSVQSVERALNILSLFTRQKPRLGVLEIAEAMNLGRSTTHNLVKTLRECGCLSQDPETRKYFLGTKLFALGIIIAGNLEINQKAHAPASRISNQVHLTCRIAIWEEDAALVTLDMSPGYSDPLALRVGPRVVGYCSSIGRVMLAHMNMDYVEKYLNRVQLRVFTKHTMVDRYGILAEIERTKNRGFALNNQEMAIGRASVAAPIFKADGEVAAAISLSGNPNQIVNGRSQTVTDQLVQTAREISRYMGYFG